MKTMILSGKLINVCIWFSVWYSLKVVSLIVLCRLTLCKVDLESNYPVNSHFKIMS